MIRLTFVLKGAVVLGASALGWRGGRGTGEAGALTSDAVGDQFQTVPAGQLPEEFAKTADVQRLYRYAAGHGDELQYMPCFCGCFRFGYRSNRDCSIKVNKGDGALTFTTHAVT